MRDMLTQREQTEKHRLAEFLDPEVKRWSNGKEGNLRALLSTLQYVRILTYMTSVSTIFSLLLLLLNFAEPCIPFACPFSVLGYILLLTSSKLCAKLISGNLRNDFESWELPLITQLQK
ncbi:unnamed protein product [Triticum turgidum subsp. durum]|uniref:Uncharacterized protein n=1 Tax=Triticum turgidum subsp. durum TaxID=4567 RepID=A0A9R1QHW4_TRITD|nr:unnamed protein product [Triticum turgidum subsp. durum]